MADRLAHTFSYLSKKKKNGGAIVKTVHFYLGYTLFGGQRNLCGDSILDLPVRFSRLFVFEIQKLRIGSCKEFD